MKKIVIAIAALISLSAGFWFNSQDVDAAYGDMGNVIIPQKFRGVWKDKKTGETIIVGKSSIAGFKLKYFDQNYYNVFHKFSHKKQETIKKLTDSWMITGTKTRKNSKEYIIYKWLEPTFPDNHYIFKKISGNKYSLTYRFATSTQMISKYVKIS